MLDIGQVVARSGLPTSTLHLWERKGLVESTGRVGLRRQYDVDILQRLAVIVVAQRSGFTLAEIRHLLVSPSDTEGRASMQTKLTELRQRRDELDAAINGIEHGLACAFDSPMMCPTFLAGLESVLPVREKNT